MNTRNNISDNENFKGKNPFKTSDDYFESFINKLQHRVDEFEELKTEAPILSTIPKYNPFETPCDYFDELPTHVQLHIINNKPVIALVEWLLLLIKPRFVLPVLTVTIIAIAGINLTNKNAGTASTQTIEETSLEEHLYTIDESTIIDAVASNVSTQNPSEDDNSIENYLIDNNIDELALK
jgi:hypothetical protein